MKKYSQSFTLSLKSMLFYYCQAKRGFTLLRKVKNNYYILPVLMSLLCISCEKDVKNIKIPQSPPKLAIAAFISPQDTLIRISVAKSAPVLGKSRLTPENIKDASVILSDGTNSITLDYNDQGIQLWDQVYTADPQQLPIVAGKTYFLTVSNPEGLQATASCTVPLSHNTTLEITGDTIDNQYGGKMISMQLKWKDTPGEVNYYRYSAELTEVRETGDGQTFTNVYPTFFDSSNELVSDTRLDGTTFTSNRFSWSGPMVNNSSIISLVVNGFLLDTDEHYYRYHQSVRNNSNDNPFAEPIPIYSNVEGGLGVFAAYNRSTVTLKLK